MMNFIKEAASFCLWPSKYTEHSVKNSPLQRDIVREASDACRKGGIKFGFYLSPWNRNSQYYGTPAYNDYFCDQLTELLTEYAFAMTVHRIPSHTTACSLKSRSGKSNILLSASMVGSLK